MSSNPANPKSLEQESFKSFSTAREALREFEENGYAIKKFIDSLNSSKEELSAEVFLLREREAKLSLELSTLSNLNELLEQKSLEISELERKRIIQEEANNELKEELSYKTKSLLQLKDEYKKNLDRLSGLEEDLESTKIICHDSERRREQIQALLEEVQKDLASNKKEISETNSLLLEKTALHNEAQAKLSDLEEALMRANTHGQELSEELKKTKWDLLQYREELKVVKGELERKLNLIKDKEIELEIRADTISNQNELNSALESDLQRAQNRITFQEEALQRLTEKATEQVTLIAQKEQEFSFLVNELDQAQLFVRTAEEKRRLLESDILSKEEEIVILRDFVRKRSSEIELKDKKIVEIQDSLENKINRLDEVSAQYQRINTELATVRDQNIYLQQTLATSAKEIQKQEEEKNRNFEEYERIQRELKNVLRVEAQQAKELEQIRQEFCLKSESLRDAQAGLSNIREQRDVLSMKYEQQSVSYLEAQRKIKKLQEDLQAYKYQLNRAVKPTISELEIAELRKQIIAKDLLLEEQDQEITMLQGKLADKRVVHMASRESQMNKGIAFIKTDDEIIAEQAVNLKNNT